MQANHEFQDSVLGQHLPQQPQPVPVHELQPQPHPSVMTPPTTFGQVLSMVRLASV